MGHCGVSYKQSISDVSKYCKGNFKLTCDLCDNRKNTNLDHPANILIFPAINISIVIHRFFSLQSKWQYFVSEVATELWLVMATSKNWKLSNVYHAPVGITKKYHSEDGKTTKSNVLVKI